MSSGFIQELARGKALPAAFGLALAGAVLLPIRENMRDEPRDDFPLSYYPMFTAKRSKFTGVTYLAGLDASGERCILPCALAGTGGLNQVRRQINRTVREGRADELCKSVARAVAGDNRPELADIQTVMIIKGAYRLPRYFAGDKEPHRERIIASHDVRRCAE